EAHGVGAVLNSKFVETTHHTGGQLSSEEVAVFVNIARGFLLLGQVGHGVDAYQLQRIAAGNRESVANVQFVVLDEGVVAVTRVGVGVSHRQLARASLDILDTCAVAGVVQIEQVQLMDVFTLVKALTGPQGCARQRLDDVFAGNIDLTECQVAAGVWVSAIRGGFLIREIHAANVVKSIQCLVIVALTVGAVGNHGIDSEGLAVLAEQFITKTDFRIGITLISKSTHVVAVCAVTKTGLFTATAKVGGGTSTRITVEINGQGRGGQNRSSDGGGQGEFFHKQALVVLHRLYPVRCCHS